MIQIAGYPTRFLTAIPTLKKQSFTATAGQTIFQVTDFNLTDGYFVLVDDIFQITENSRSAQSVVFTAGMAEGSKVVVYDLIEVLSLSSSLTISSTLKKQTITALAGQTKFVVTDFALAENHILIVNDIIQTQLYTRSGQMITFDYGLTEGDQVVIIGITGLIGYPLKKQALTATANQTEFTVTLFDLTDDYIFIIEDVVQTANTTRSGNVVTFTPGTEEGSKIVIIN